MIQDNKVKELQDRYLLDRTDENFCNLYNEVLEISKALVFVKAKKNHVFVDYKYLSEEATLRFMEMYLKNPNWSATSIVKRIDFDVLYIMYNKKQIQHDKESEHLNEELEVKQNIVYEEDTDSVIEDLMKDSVYWRNILLDCYKARSFRGFITKLSAYENRKFCEDHMERLKKLYKHTRKDLDERKSFNGFMTKLSTIEGPSINTERLKNLYRNKKEK